MRIDINQFRENTLGLLRRQGHGHDAKARLRPSLFQYDYLLLHALSRDVQSLIAEVTAAGVSGGSALDLGCGVSPYSSVLQSRGFHVHTMDVSTEAGADFAGTIEATRLPDNGLDLVICTQVLEHCEHPGAGLGEIARILRPGGFVIVTAPHVWFYHPHPADRWRFTQEGILDLCWRAGLRPTTLLGQGGTALALAQIANFALFGVLGTLGAPIYLVGNIAGSLLNMAIDNDLFCMNFACLARKVA